MLQLAPMRLNGKPRIVKTGEAAYTVSGILELTGLGVEATIEKGPPLIMNVTIETEPGVWYALKDCNIGFTSGPPTYSDGGWDADIIGARIGGKSVWIEGILDLRAGPITRATAFK